MTQQDAASFRRRAFEVDWLSALAEAGIEAEAQDPIAALLLAEGEQWLSAGEGIGYFNEGRSNFPAPLLEMGLAFAQYKPSSPTDFTTNLALAFESVTPEHLRFLHLAMFATEPEWVMAFSEASEVVERFVSRPQTAFVPEIIDKIEWFIEGPLETDTYHTPSGWRTGIVLVHGETGRARRIRWYQLARLTERLFAAVQRELEDEASAVPTVKLEARAPTRSEAGGYMEITGLAATGAEAAEEAVEGYPGFGQEQFQRREGT
jgi:hypothetical protein